MKANEQHFSVLLFIMLHRVVLAIKIITKILTSNHLNISY